MVLVALHWLFGARRWVLFKEKKNHFFFCLLFLLHIAVLLLLIIRPDCLHTVYGIRHIEIRKTSQSGIFLCVCVCMCITITKIKIYNMYVCMYGQGKREASAIAISTTWKEISLLQWWLNKWIHTLEGDADKHGMFSLFVVLAQRLF